MAKKHKKRFGHKIKVFLAFIVFGTITVVLGYNLFSNIMTINEMKLEKRELKDKIATLQEEKKTLETDIKKLEDAEYIAKYVREKYFYSKDGEVILRMDK